MFFFFKFQTTAVKLYPELIESILLAEQYSLAFEK